MNTSEKVPVNDGSVVIYSFSCCSAQKHVCYTTQCQFTRNREHTPAWLAGGYMKTINSAFVGHGEVGIMLYRCTHAKESTESPIANEKP